VRHIAPICCGFRLNHPTTSEYTVVSFFEIKRAVDLVNRPGLRPYARVARWAQPDEWAVSNAAMTCPGTRGGRSDTGQRNRREKEA
jgi:hypothetical protein